MGSSLSSEEIEYHGLKRTHVRIHASLDSNPRVLPADLGQVPQSVQALIFPLVK